MSFQDSAAGHAAHLGVGFPQLSVQNMTWFVTKYYVKVKRYPVFGETIRVKTWPKAKKRLFAIRDFEMSVGEEPIAAGSSVWCLVDLETRKAAERKQDTAGSA
ncbi:MAG: thioesterase [Synergistota bacterium]|nr:thioesterase [Synergistota bacterium]